MSNERSVRGTMVQQGVLTACINVEKGGNPTAIMKKNIQASRHCIARMLISINPSLLTSAQRMGSIKPLILALREVDSGELLQFESLLSLTNIAASGDDAKKKIVAERGISSIHFGMFSQNPM